MVQLSIEHGPGVFTLPCLITGGTDESTAPDSLHLVREGEGSGFDNGGMLIERLDKLAKYQWEIFGILKWVGT